MKRLLTIIIFIAGLLIGIYKYLPYQSIGKLAMSIAHDQLQRRGMRLNYSDVSGEEVGFTVNNLKLSGMPSVSLSSVTIKPEYLSSLATLSPVCEITFKGASIRLGQVLNLGDGGFLLTAGNEVMLENLRTNGEFSLNGNMTIDMSNMRIGRAEARLEVPESFSQNMGMLRSFLPLVQEGDKWYLRR